MRSRRSAQKRPRTSHRSRAEGVARVQGRGGVADAFKHDRCRRSSQVTSRHGQRCGLRSGIDGNSPLSCIGHNRSSQVKLRTQIRKSIIPELIAARCFGRAGSRGRRLWLGTASRPQSGFNPSAEHPKKTVADRQSGRASDDRRGRHADPRLSAPRADTHSAKISRGAVLMQFAWFSVGTTSPAMGESNTARRRPFLISRISDHD